jgi:hypothetical protein
MDFDNTVVLSNDSILEIRWWIQHIRCKNGKKIRQKKVDLICRTDASNLGWGGIDLNSKRVVQGRWDVKESEFHINYLELLAISLSLQGLYATVDNVHIQVQSDNVSAVSYVNDMGGMTSVSMDALASSIWHWCINKNIYVSAVYIPGVENSADFFSRNFSDSTEWMLKKDIFLRICKEFFVPNVDLFASRINKQVDTFVSWFPEPGAIFCDAFSVNWGKFLPYIFPPFNLVGKVVNKVIRDKVDRAILIFPHWTGQPWFPLLLDSMCSYPVILPRHKDLLVLPHNNLPHPLCHRLRMAAVIVSGTHWRCRDFQKELLASSFLPGVLEPRDNTSMHGTPGVCGVIAGREVQFKRLKLK